MNIALLCSNLFSIDEKNKTGTGIFNHILIRELVREKREDLNITVFASGESAASLPAKVASIGYEPSSADPRIIKNGKHVMFELALLSKAFSQQDAFDIYHMNIGDGDLAVPFAAFVKKPILITLHNFINEDFTRTYFSLFKDQKNIFFISTSNYQRKMLPMVQYADTIYHGIDTGQFDFDPNGGDDIMWAGRFIPEKGPDTIIQLARKLNRAARLFGIVKDGYEDWFKENIKKASETEATRSLVSVVSNLPRPHLPVQYRKSKLFLLPTLFEEAFGLVFAESMACGTPVVTFARGAAPEVIQDGITGFLVNPSDDDIRGDWVIKKTGFAGLCEAVEMIYAMQDDEYVRMRRACRKRAVENFSAEKMAEKYMEAYKKITLKK